jgi:arylsulfatase A-like enzyme
VPSATSVPLGHVIAFETTTLMSGQPLSFGFTPRRVTDAEFLFAALLGLAAVMVRQRIEMVYCVWRSDLWLYLPLLAYQDVIALTILGWVSYGLFALARNPYVRGGITRAGWYFLLLLALYTSVDTVVFSYIHTDATYKLFVLSDNLRMVEKSIPDALGGGGPYLWVVIGILMFVLVAESLSRFAPDFLRRLRARFYSPLALALIVAYVVGAHAWAERYLSYPPAALNAEWAFVSPLFQDPPNVTVSIPPAYLDDFLPAGERPAAPSALMSVALRTARPLNVVMVVMESVGTRNLGLYGASYDDTPQLERLAAHAAVFDHVYAAQGNTSAAMTAIFCSLYPRLAWFPVPRWKPELATAGLPAILAGRGYATGFLDSGSIGEDRRAEFLLNHGFATVAAEHRDPRLPQDGPLLPAAVSWIDAHKSRPFFLSLWTMDTHHPYIVAGDQNYGVRDPALGRYLNGVQSMDALIGQLADQLQKMGLADNTLLVITGDHGEAFNEHGQTVHGFTAYNEELQIPLLIINPRLFKNQRLMNGPGRQIDIAPTLLSLLGVPEPAQWQGMSLFQRPRRRRVYMFSGNGNYVLGLIDGNMKYIYDFNTDRAELYDLAADPHEHNNLSSDPAYTLLMRREKLHLQAWTSFQNPYLRRLASVPSSDGY